MSIDPAFDMPQINWVQQGSFEPGSIPPAGEPTAGVQVWLGPVNQTYLPWVCGALDQGRNPSSWIAADDTAMADILRRWGELMGLLCGNNGSGMPVMIRLQGCVLQTSIDGGVTWVDVPGWSSGFCGCVQDCVPPSPPGLPGLPIAQRACNISGYLANNLIQASIQSAINSFNAGHSLLQWAADLGISIFGAALPLTALFSEALVIIHGIITNANIAAFESAAADPTLWNKVKCAIYLAIRADGQVTDANFPTIVANICGITYANPDVATAVCDYVTALTAVSLRSLQGSAVLADYNCEDCTPWCVRWGPLVTDRPLSEWSAVSGFGTLTGGVWTSVVSGGDQRLQIQLTPPAAGHVTGCEVRGFANGGSVASDRQMEFLPASVNCFFPTVTGNFDTTCTVAAPGTNYMAIAVFTRADTVPPPNTVQNILVRGIGTNPWGTSNC